MNGKDLVLYLAFLRCGFPLLLSVPFGVYKFAQEEVLDFLIAFSWSTAETKSAISSLNLCTKCMYV